MNAPAKLAQLLLASPLLAAPLLASRSAQAATHDVAVLVWSENIPGQVAMLDGLKARAEELNEQALAADPAADTVDLQILVAGDGPLGIENQIAQMTAVVAQGVDLIIVQPTDNAALARPLQAANAADIPVVAYDQYILGGQLAAYLTSDNRQAGRQDGEYVASRFADDKVLQLAVVEYPHVSSTVERLDGFLDALARSGQPFRIVGTYLGVDPESGARAAAQLLAEHPQPGSVDVVFTVNDGGGLAVVDALVAAGRTEVMVATIDGDPASVENIRNGRLTVIDSAQFCGPLGAQAMTAGWDLLHGRPVAAHVLIPTFPITAETLDRYPGWLGPLPQAFEKPWPALEPTWSPEITVVRGPDSP